MSTNKEEQVGKVRKGKIAIPDNKMPDLGWDATEELEVQEVSQIKHIVPILPETIMTIALVIITFLENFKTYIQEISKISRKAVQAVTRMTRTIGHNNLSERASETYRRTVQAIIDVTRTTHCNSHSNPHRIPHRNHHNWTFKQKLSDSYNRSYRQHKNNTPAITTTSKTSCSTVSEVLCKDRAKHGKTEGVFCLVGESVEYSQILYLRMNVSMGNVGSLDL